MKVDYDTYQAMNSDERRAYHAERDSMTESELLIEKLMDANDRLETRFSTLFADFNNLSIRIEKRLDVQANRLEPVNDRLAIHVTRLDAQSSSIDSLIERDELLDRKYENRSDRHASRFEAIDDRLDAQAIVVAKRGEQIEGMSDMLGFAVAPLELKISDLAEKLSDVEFQLEGKVDDLDREHADRLLAVESELEDTTRTANSAEMTVNDVKMDVSSLESKIESTDSALSSLDHTVRYG